MFKMAVCRCPAHRLAAGGDNDGGTLHQRGERTASRQTPASLAFPEDVALFCQDYIGLLRDYREFPSRFGTEFLRGWSLWKGVGRETAEGLPFLLEDRLRELGATFVAAPKWVDHVERDGMLITGQNPQSSVNGREVDGRPGRRRIG